MVMEEFYQILQSNKNIFGSNDFTKQLIESAFKSDQTNTLIDELSLTSNANLESLGLIDQNISKLFTEVSIPKRWL